MDNLVDRSEEEKKKELEEKLKSVSPYDFVLFFAAKKIAPLHCPICGSVSMTFPLIAGETTVTPTGFEQKEYLVASRAAIDSDPNSFTSYQYRIICKNCTYEMAFNAQLLINWLDERNNGVLDEN